MKVSLKHISLTDTRWGVRFSMDVQNGVRVQVGEARARGVSAAKEVLLDRVRFLRVPLILRSPAPEHENRQELPWIKNSAWTGLT